MAIKANEVSLVIALLIIAISSVLVLPQFLSYMAVEQSSENYLLYTLTEYGTVLFTVSIIVLIVGKLIGGKDV